MNLAASFVSGFVCFNVETRSTVVAHLVLLRRILMSSEIWRVVIGHQPANQLKQAAASFAYCSHISQDK